MANRMDTPHDPAAAAADATKLEDATQGTQPEAHAAPAPQVTGEPSAPKADAPRPEIKPEPRPERPRAAQTSDASTIKPEAPQPVRNLPVLHKAPAKEKARGRFALLAATVALAACAGAVTGSLGMAGIERLLVPAATNTADQASQAQNQSSSELKALRDQIAQLRTATKQLGDSVAAARASMTQAGTATTGQLAKIAEAVERIERKTAELRAAQAAPAPAQGAAADVTGSIAPGAPAAAAKPKPIVPGWTLRRVVDGGALVGGPFGLIEIEPGETVPGLGRIEEIRREDGRWVVVTRRGLIVPR